MPWEMRFAGFWLVACSAVIGSAFASRQYALLPDVYVASWLAHTIVLFLVIAAVASLYSGPVGRTRTAWIGILVGGHLAAIASTHEFLTSRIHCVDVSTAIEYRLPDEAGAFILFGPSLALVLLSLVMRRPPRRCT